MEKPGAPDQGFGHRENGSQSHQPNVHGRAVEHEGHDDHGADDEPEKHGGLAGQRTTSRPHSLQSANVPAVRLRTRSASTAGMEYGHPLQSDPENRTTALEPNEARLPS